MTTQTQIEPMTAEAFFSWVDLPENSDPWFELVRGEVIELPPPAKIHGRVCTNSAFELETYVRRRRRGYVTSNDARVILERDPDTVRGPDVALYEDATTFAELHPGYGEVVPLLAVEVLSPNDRARQVTRKITDYLTSGVAIVWLVDPEDCSVTVYRRDRGPVRTDARGDLTGEEILPNLRLRVGDLFTVPGELGSPKPPATRGMKDDQEPLPLSL